MERVRCLERLSSVLDRKPIRHLLLVRQEPFRVLGCRRPGVFRQSAPLEEPTADDLRRLRFCGHDDRLAKAIEQLLQPLEVGLVLGAHFEL